MLVGQWSRCLKCNKNTKHKHEGRRTAKVSVMMTSQCASVKSRKDSIPFYTSAIFSTVHITQTVLNLYCTVCSTVRTGFGHSKKAKCHWDVLQSLQRAQSKISVYSILFLTRCNHNNQRSTIEPYMPITYYQRVPNNKLTHLKSTWPTSALISA